MKIHQAKLVQLDTKHPIWSHFFTVAPLVVVGTKEGDGFDLAPKHMAMPMGHSNYFGFICTPRHSTYHNVEREKFFTVSFPKPQQVVMASLASSPRCEEAAFGKPIMSVLPYFEAPQLEAPLLEDAYLHLECRHHKTVDGFGDHSLITGKIIGAYVDKDYMRQVEGDDLDLVHQAPLLAFLAYGRYAEVKNSKTFPYPKDFNF